MHNFDDSFEGVKPYEAELDKYFSTAYEIQPASREQERSGVDRIFTHKASGLRYSVEYKVDMHTATTGNVFIETTSVDSEDKCGWALTSTAQILMYFIPQWGKVLRCNMLDVKRSLADWECYPLQRVPNESRTGERYNTLGRLVKLDAFESICVGSHNTGFTLDAGASSQGQDTCIHDVSVSACKVCNGTVRRMIVEAS
jgi:hypothetical protein